jgi:hypothetical protein
MTKVLLLVPGCGRGWVKASEVHQTPLHIMPWPMPPPLERSGADRVRRAFDLAFENGVLWNPQIFEILDAATRR